MIQARILPLSFAAYLYPICLIEVFCMEGVVVKIS